MADILDFIMLEATCFALFVHVSHMNRGFVGVMRSLQPMVSLSTSMGDKSVPRSLVVVEYLLYPLALLENPPSIPDARVFCTGHYFFSYCNQALFWHTLNKIAINDNYIDNKNYDQTTS